MFSVGDSSGDLYASFLIQKLKLLKGEWYVSGVGGALMASAGASLWGFTPPFGAFGFAASFKVGPYHWVLYRKMRRTLQSHPPDLFIPVDFGTFNRPLVCMLRQLGKKVFYFVPPSFFGESAARVRRLVGPSVIFSPIYWWQKEILQRAGAQMVEFGHPLVDILRPVLGVSQLDARHRLKLPTDRMIVGLFPGSRRTTVSDHALVLFQSAETVARYCPVHFALALPHGWRREWIDSFIPPSFDARSLSVHIGTSHLVLRASDLAICAAGTVTLEAAYLGVPSLAFFRTNLANRLQVHWLRWRGLSLERLGPFALPNRILGRIVMPELVAWSATEESLTDWFLRLIGDRDQREKMKRDLEKIRETMGEPGVFDRIGQFLVQWVASE